MEQADEWELEQDSGYDIELFVNAPDPEFICTVCHGVLKGPVELCCQHVFCKSCISNWLARKQECPYCRKKVKGVTRSVIPMIHNMIGRLIMKCENKVYGCRYTFPLEQYKNHKAACEFRIVSCRYEGCATEIFHKNITAHEQVCEHWNQPCRMGCGVQLNRNQLEEHNCYRDAKRKYKEKITVLKRRLSCMRRRLKLVEGIVQSLTAGNRVQLLESCVCRDADISGLPTESQEKGGSSNNIFDALEYSENESQYSCNSASTLEKADEPPIEDGESEGINDGEMDEAIPDHIIEDSVSSSSTEQEPSLYGDHAGSQTSHLYFETDDVNENTASQIANTSIGQSAAVRKRHRPWILHSLRRQKYSWKRSRLNSGFFPR